MNATHPVALTKMHGAGNAFVLYDERAYGPAEYAKLARAFCAPDGPFDGADGLLVVAQAPGALARMRVINADGSEAEMCGNGVRCVARLLAEAGAPDRFKIATLAGPIGIEVLARDPAWSIRTDVGPVAFPGDGAEETIGAGGARRAYVRVSLGNPHVVVPVDDLRTIDVERTGREIATAERFPGGTNVHFVQRLDADAIRVHHFERGVGVTPACGTGIVASAAVAIVRMGVAAPVSVEAPGGTLRVRWAPGENARLTGPVERLFERTLDL